MSSIFPKGLPVNAFINKGRCGIGGTTLEIKDKSRTTLLVVPNISILKSKMMAKNADERPDYIIFGGVSRPEVVNIVKELRKGEKIMCTPEATRKIVRAAKSVNRWEEMKQEWFLLLDECHTFITEEYRKDILAPFDYFWEFKNKSIISATPYYFSDKRFYSLDLHEVTFTEKLGKITLMNAVSVDGTLNYILNNTDQAQGNIHIFYNSVTAIRDAVIRSEIADCNIFCANDKDNSNIEKLGDLAKFFVEEPKTDIYKKVNFYTCKYFEGWDLYDEGATIILVTDRYKPYTKIGVGSKGKQAIGRLRNSGEQFMHITNHEKEKVKITLEEFKTEYLKEANTLIDANNSHIRQSKFGKFKGNDMLHKFADVEDETKLATLNRMKLDQQINESANNEIYKHIDFIKEDWEKAFFEVEVQYSPFKLESKTTIERKSGATKLKQDYLEILEFRREHGGSSWFYFGEPLDQQINKTNPLAFKAANLLDPQTMEEHKWNLKKIEQLVIVKSNEDAYIKLQKLAKRIFNKKQGRPDNFHFNSEVTEKLRTLFVDLEIRDPKTGRIREATPSLFSEVTGFRAKTAKRVNSDGKKENGLVIDTTSLILKLTD